MSVAAMQGRLLRQADQGKDHGRSAPCTAMTGLRDEGRRTGWTGHTAKGCAGETSACGVCHG